MYSSLANGTCAAPWLATSRTTTGPVLTSRSTRMRPTADQLSGRNSARSSRFAKSVASTIATSAGRPDPAQSVRHDRARPSVRLLAAPPPKGPASFSGGSTDPHCWPPLCLPSPKRSPKRTPKRCLACRESIGRRPLSGMRFWRRTGQSRHPLDSALLSSVSGERGAPAARRHRLQSRQSLAPAGFASPHPELVPHEPPTAALQDRRAPHSTCPVLHSSAGRKPIDSASVCADHPPHRAARVASDVIKSDGPCWEHAWRRRRECLEGGEAASGSPWDLRDQRLGVARTVPVTEHEWPNWGRPLSSTRGKRTWS